MSYMDKISAKEILAFLIKKGVNGDVIQLHDTLGNQQLFRIEIKGKHDLKSQKQIEQEIQSQFHTKVTDVQFINENIHFDYNKSHMLVYDIERKYNNIFSGKLQVSIGDKVYGYDILFDDMKGIIEWNKDFNEINQEHMDDGSSRDFKGLIDMFNIDLQNHVNIEKYVKKPVSKSKKKAIIPKILLNYDQNKGTINYVLIQDLTLSSTAFNKLAQELSSQSLYVTYEKRKSEEDTTPTEIFVGKSGGHLSETDMTNLTKILSKNGVDTSDYKFVNVENLSLLPASALIRASIKYQPADL